ncbi:hypothetical protein [Sphingomonas sp. CV7422]|uniref:hypothetical protein n=1 Tax=Sphingomonas sp. CV7422 TaxID=3018036 RepID=UPI0022FE0C8F|nr:hypothetical protein [Sphingomonas sp. CV7422]
MRRDGIAIALVCAGVLAAAPARASEGMFSRVYTADFTPSDHVEIEQVVRERAGRVFGHYDATDLRTELEYGVTDNFQAALYVNTNRMHATRTSDDDDEQADTGFTRHYVTLESISTEFVYRALSPYKSRQGWGLALDLEPEYAFHDLHNGLRYAPGTFLLEGRAIVQEKFAGSADPCLQSRPRGGIDPLRRPARHQQRARLEQRARRHLSHRAARLPRRRVPQPQ